MGEFVGWVGSQLLELVLPALATVIAGLVVGLLRKMLKKLQLELTAEQDTRIRQLVADAVRTVEERSRRDGLSSREKADAAMAIVADQVPQVRALDVQRMIDAALPGMRKEAGDPPRPSSQATFGR